ncbi:Oxidoreductase NAD-binding domain-containing protein [Colletotrichum higginsianum IMI 349063]|uniref:Oxidoreductase NAD-binding domain-containing protein n=1 Tax=Colletotrichum higginsianum (strain IMI 349063) TaxID=759273 RepID=A0A1B7YNG0_COLHI|nr:Oxidoreductase NAD-binding domain-containing protein [Colletotrichum higginsianum IMI 349063]OBR13462.1 Oxidoreductase NAD-binding domain-containing protein [Colletotrichum higginsianum IMI 349063]
MATTEGPEFTAKEVAAHREANDCWMVIHGEVYDVSKYIDDHPGGADVLVEAAGVDATEAFDNAGHSEDASEIMATFRVGKLKGVNKRSAPKAVRLAPKSTTAAPASSTAGSAARVASQAAAAALFIGLGAVAARHASSTPAGQDAIAAIQRLNLQLPSWLSLGGAARTKRTGFGFVEGFAVASAFFAVAGSIAAKEASKLLHYEITPMHYRPHQKMPKVAKPNPLNQRGWLDPVSYHPLPLAEKTLLAPNVYRFVFELPTPTTVLGLPIGQHVSIKAEIDGKSVSRSYTPTSNNSDLGRLELVIRCYPDGLLTGKYLANLEVGDEVLFRGPKGAMRYHPNMAKKIGMLAGGTGITPMYQLIRAICEDDRDTTEVSLIYANRSEADILLRNELEAFARRYPKNLKLHYLLDAPPENWTYGVGYVTQEMMAERFPAPGDGSRVMLCGPPGMVAGAKKSLANLGFEKPGAIAKMSDAVFCF